ncbi:MAG: DUF962 domain-containing protein [Pyrinomonadaceae bacterium]|nr:DUF962 domain-containing protein [Pyrinomonadaceae bacterium]MCX7640112.1 DUF962 domain-containing protein [Pyrinomonadaceae bacterium]MDW8303300.1 DUF962 domain-containing protein [Acidobacteriota bacterium]
MKVQSYSEFWDFYVREHSKPLTRWLHFLGTLIATILFIWLVWQRAWYYLPLCLLVGYGLAWFSHFFIEKNKPATFKYPLWSFVSDYKMMFLMLTGKMNREVERILGR